MSIPVLLALILAVALPVQLLRAYRPDERSVELWMRDRDVELTHEARAMVAAYLRSARVSRAWGAAAGERPASRGAHSRTSCPGA